MKLTDAHTGEAVHTVEGAIEWHPAGIHQAASHTWKWSMFVPHWVSGVRGEMYQIGGLDTGIEVYHSGRLSIPGEADLKFDTVEEAKAYAEATYELEKEP